ncbi:uncharacterized protein EAE97_007757 [Botrytis byssoidea]|uniref:Uncharacterized protein n=1 Tax=Botrytis byssoidea TaxID=139641 RepID=A0A9P5IG55_9HELO|nr:uncharacterized protein EAE97_007757 [Botrytis byssoidea]KAF7937961.1 hypothetical protein EAE97_007757 [Botrytis byssoidea]
MSSEKSDSLSGFSDLDEDFYFPSHDPRASSSEQDYVDAMRGEFVPKNLRHEKMIFCIVHGLRYNIAFAESAPMKEICAKSTNKIFARARNARLIMSDKVPLMRDDEEKPYCIWHPQVASVDTYRELVQKYPDMKYHVGRACAVGGYSDLYRELDLLPDISIAEEARDNLTVVGSKEIFDLIMCQPTHYAAMDDYTRSVNWKAPRRVIGLNGDTAVLSSLRATVEFTEECSRTRSYYFNITEDHCISETSSGQTHSLPLAPEHVSLLYNPLPLHLPTMNKDTLILHAAYEGNIDRYARLRRPVMIPQETEAIVRAHSPHLYDVRAAVLARFIMVNDLSRITDRSTATTDTITGAEYWPEPFLIWWPLIPLELTLRELVRRRPNMLRQVAMACIAADYFQLWKRRAAEKNINLLAYAPERDDGLECTRRDKEPTEIFLSPYIRADEDFLRDWMTYRSIYPGSQVNAARWDLCIAVSDDLREQVRNENTDDSLDENCGWPYSIWNVWG